MPPSIPYKRLAGFYGLWFGALGALLPYWGLYLQHQGYDAAVIGVVFAILLGTKMVAPNVWGWLADRSGRRVPIIRLASVVAALTFLAVPYAGALLPLALLMGLYGFFSNASLPQFEALTFNHLGEDMSRYGRVRLWGSVGFIISVASLGALLDYSGVGVVPWWIMACLTALCLLSFAIPEAGNGLSRSGGDQLWGLLRQRRIQCLLAVCFLVQFSHGAYYAFFSIYLADHGYDRALIGGLWALGVVAEIFVFALLPWLLAIAGLRTLMLIAMVGTTVRWLLLAAFPSLLSVLVVVQLLHLASFGLYHAVAVSLIHRLFRGRLQGRGQALYSSVSFGAGGAAGALVSGLLWQALPHPTVFVTSAIAAALAGLVTWW
ncbi:MAG: MFS transporter [Salinisphaera sp.]|nr:MFS transporter [Salinisphaera sp.]